MPGGVSVKHTLWTADLVGEGGIPIYMGSIGLCHSRVGFSRVLILNRVSFLTLLVLSFPRTVAPKAAAT